MDMNSIGHQEILRSERTWSEPEAKMSKKEDPHLREACEQFEGLLLGILLKESLATQPAAEGDEESGAGGFDQFREFCVEQVATSLAGSASMGIADQLYEQMSQQGVSR